MDNATLKALQLRIDPEAAAIIEHLKSKNTKSLFVCEAIKKYAEMQESKIFLNHENSNEKEKISVQANEETEHNIPIKEEKREAKKMCEW